MAGIREHGGVWVAMAAVVAVGLVCTIGEAETGYDTLTKVRGAVLGLLISGWPAGVYLLSAFGLGRLARRLFCMSTFAGTIQLIIGIALMLSLSHGLGVLGVLTTPVAIGVGVVGCGLAIEQLARTWRAGRERGERRADVRTALSFGWLAWVPGVVVLLVACSAPPGSMWASEYGQYDSLSYHLQLPQEWWRAGQIWPVEHNVYSFLPGYVESAFMHLSALTAAPVDGQGWTGEPGHGLLAGTGWRALAPHYLHAGLGLMAAWMVACGVRALAARAGMDANDRGVCTLALVVGGVVISTPWVVVVGSISYNELGVAALGTGALLVALDEKVAPAWRGAIAGALVGVACGCKPTALFMVGPAVGVALLGLLPMNERVTGVVRISLKLALPGAVAGVVALSPWLIRNELATGNPVFPAMAGVFGEGHWTPEQHERWRAAHTYEGTFTDRIVTLVWESPDRRVAEPDPFGDPSGAAPLRPRTLVERFRGAANPQWGALFAWGVAGGVFALIRRRTRRLGAVLLVGLGAQIGCWVALTHLQSRFLLPCVVTLGPLVGIGLASRLIPRKDERVLAWRAAAMAALAAVSQAGFLLAVFAKEGGVRGVGIDPSFRAGRPWVETSSLLPSATVSHGLGHGTLGENARVYLFAEGAPFYYEKDVVYNTTYDGWLLSELVQSWPGEPEAWVDGLRDAGITHVVFNSDEYLRLSASGWSDPVLTDDVVRTWVSRLGELKGHWPRSDGTGGVLLFELAPGDQGSTQ